MHILIGDDNALGGMSAIVTYKMQTYPHLHLLSSVTRDLVLY